MRANPQEGADTMSQTDFSDHTALADAALARPARKTPCDFIPGPLSYFHGAWDIGLGDSMYRDRDLKLTRWERWMERGRD